MAGPPPPPPPELRNPKRSCGDCKCSRLPETEKTAKGCPCGPGFTCGACRPPDEEGEPEQITEPDESFTPEFIALLKERGIELADWRPSGIPFRGITATVDRDSLKPGSDEWVKIKLAEIDLISARRQKFFDEWEALDADVMKVTVKNEWQSESPRTGSYTADGLFDPSGSDQYSAILKELEELHSLKSGGYGTGEDPYNNFSAVAVLTGQPRYLYATLRAIEKLTRVLSLHEQGRVEELSEEFTDIASLAICAEALRRLDA